MTEGNAPPKIKVSLVSAMTEIETYKALNVTEERRFFLS
jgi:hypothetical protein